MVHIWGKIEKRLEITIDKYGKILIPEIGEVYLWQKTLEQAQKLIKNIINKTIKLFYK